MPIAAHPHPERRAKMSLDPADASGCRESGDTKEPPAENYSFTTMTFSIFVREHLQGNSWSLEKHPRMLWLLSPPFQMSWKRVMATSRLPWQRIHLGSCSLRFCSPITLRQYMKPIALGLFTCLSLAVGSAKQGSILPTVKCLEPSRVSGKFYFLNKDLLADWLK